MTGTLVCHVPGCTCPGAPQKKKPPEIPKWAGVVFVLVLIALACGCIASGAPRPVLCIHPIAESCDAREDCRLVEKIKVFWRWSDRIEPDDFCRDTPRSLWPREMIEARRWGHV